MLWTPWRKHGWSCEGRPRSDVDNVDRRERGPPRPRAAARRARGYGKAGLAGRNYGGKSRCQGITLYHFDFLRQSAPPSLKEDLWGKSARGEITPQCVSYPLLSDPFPGRRPLWTTVPESLPPNLGRRPKTQGNPHLWLRWDAAKTDSPPLALRPKNSYESYLLP